MSALPAVLEPEHGDTDDGGDALVRFIALLTVRLARRGELIRTALRQDVEAALADMKE